MNKKIKVGSDFSGVGAFNQSIIRMGLDYEEVHACDMDKFSRLTFLLNYGAEEDLEILKTPECQKIDSIYYREYNSPKKPSKEEWDFVHENEERIARSFSFYYPWNVYSREISEESLDIFMTSPPCQAFSLAGKRKGEEDKRGVLFYNSHEFIQKNKPRFFIFENVKGLLSDDSGKTFQRWIDLLGGKTVNGNPVIFPHEDSVPYHVYYQVLNAKHYGIPQNRERIFIIGIRDDADNNFSFPKPFPLEKRLKDVLEKEVDDKYFLSDKMISGLINDGGKKFINKDTQASKVFSSEEESPTISAGTHGYANGYIEIGDWRKDEGFRWREDGNSPTLCARAREDGSGQPIVKLGAIRGRNPDNPKSRVAGLETMQMVEINEDPELCNTLTTVQKYNVVVESQRIRRLLPIECFRLMDFNEDMAEKTIKSGLTSDSQLYKQAGNSICVGVLAKIIERLNL